MTNDYFVLLSHPVALSVNLCNGEEKTFIINLNLRTGDYLRIIAETEQLTQQVNDIARIDNLCNAVFFILRNSDKKVNPQWIMENISIVDQQQILIRVTDAVYKIISKKELQVPDVSVRKKPGKKDDTEKTRDEIKKLYALLNDKLKSNILDDVAILMTKTNNTYEDIMRMPILVFRDLVKIITINELKTNDDWHLAYLSRMADEIKQNLQDGAIETSMPKNEIRADLHKLKGML